MKKIVLLISVLLTVGGLLYADCEYDGKIYSEGTIRGPYICVDGEWIRR